jgi:hypothetical protein
MTDKVKYVIFDKRLRDILKKRGVHTDIDIEQSTDISLEELQEEMVESNKSFIKLLYGLPKGRKYLKKNPETLELFNITNMDDEIIFKQLEVINEFCSEIEVEALGFQNSECGFMCLPCVGKLDVFQNYIDGDIIYFFDLKGLKAGSFYQCENCKEKFGVDGIIS